MMTGRLVTGRFATTGPTNHPGHADQSSHGRRGIRSKTKLKATYERTDKQTGLSTEVVGIQTNPPDHPQRPGWTTVDIAVTDREGLDAGFASFEIRPDGKSVFHHEMELDDGFQGQGFATRQMVHVLDSYKRNGVTEMTLTANNDVGGYAWARAGFEFASPTARSGVAMDAVKLVKRQRFDEATRAEIRRVADNPTASPADFAMIGWKPGATMWPGKEIMLRSQWDAVMRL